MLIYEIVTFKALDCIVLLNIVSSDVLTINRYTHYVHFVDLGRSQMD